MDSLADEITQKRIGERIKRALLLMKSLISLIRLGEVLVLAINGRGLCGVLRSKNLFPLRSSQTLAGISKRGDLKNLKIREANKPTRFKNKLNNARSFEFINSKEINLAWCVSITY